MVMGGAYGAVMNVATVLGVYAAVCQEERRPFSFPGGPSYVTEALDARLLGCPGLGRACAARLRPAFQHHQWRRFRVAECMIGDRRRARCPSRARSPQSLAQLLPDKADVWDEIVQRRGLRPIGIETLLGQSHFVTDFLFACGLESTPPPAFISKLKLRKAGFTKVCDTEDMFWYGLGSFIDRRIIPPRG
jgi:hypothetical protein